MNAIQFIQETQNDIACLENALRRHGPILNTEEKRVMQEKIESLRKLLPKPV